MTWFDWKWITLENFWALRWRDELPFFQWMATWLWQFPWPLHRMVILLLGAYAAKKASLWGFLSLPTLGLRNTSSQAAPQDHRAFIFICVSPAPNTVPGGLSVNGLCLRSSGLHHYDLVDNDPSSLTSSSGPQTAYCLLHVAHTVLPLCTCTPSRRAAVRAVQMFLCWYLGARFLLQDWVLVVTGSHPKNWGDFSLSAVLLSSQAS